MKKYRLIKDYPGHEIGEIALISDSIYYWQKALKNPQTGFYDITEFIPRNFKPDITPEWFEPVIELNYTIDVIYENKIYSAKNKKGINFKIGDKVKIINIETDITGFYISTNNSNNLVVITKDIDQDINAIYDYRFSTFDRVNIYRGEPYYFVVHTWDDDWIIMKDHADCSDSGKHPEKYTYFFNNNAAQIFIEEKRRQREEKTNKPIFTLNEVIHTNNINLSDTNKAKFIALANQKQNNK